MRFVYILAIQDLQLYYDGMDKQVIIELVGYLGSFLVLVSFLMTSVFKLRIINTIGSVIFMIYALIIHSYPTAVMNFCLVLINIRFLWKMRHTGHHYDLLKVEKGDMYLQYILKRQYEDIKSCFPGIDISDKENLPDVNRTYIVTCGGNPAGIVVGKEDEGIMKLILDYSFPEYRDFSIGQFLLRRLKAEGVNKLVYDGPTENHIQYLNKMGFEKVGEHYERKI